MKHLGVSGSSLRVNSSPTVVAFPTAVTALAGDQTRHYQITCGKVTVEKCGTRRNFLTKFVIGCSTAALYGKDSCAGMEEFPPERQLVSEWYTPSLATTLEFLRAFGFKVLREEPEYFAELSWGNSRSRLMVEQIEGFVVDHDGLDSASSQAPRFGWRGYFSNIRVLVPDVDSVYEVAKRTKGAIILNPLNDTDYGLRDFTVGGPFGIALRFGTPLPGFEE